MAVAALSSCPLDFFGEDSCCGLSHLAEGRELKLFVTGPSRPSDDRPLALVSFSLAETL